jgi:hypothetical protein
MPVTRHPPVQTRTCSFPASGSSVARASAQGRALVAMARREVGSDDAGPTCPGCVSCPGCMLPSSPSPGDGFSPSRRTPLDTTHQAHTAGVPGARTAPPASGHGPPRRAGSSLVPGPGFPCRASGAVDQTPWLLMGRNVWGLPSALTSLCRHATA